MIHFTVLGVTALSVLATFYLYPQLPAEIPFHWNISGEVDQYEPKIFVFVTAFLPAVLYGLMLLIPRIDPRRDSYRKHMKAYRIFILALLAFLFSLHWFTIAFSLGYSVDVVFFIKVSLGVLFLILGNYMPQIKHNYTFGIRTPWTLADENSWRKTHRLGGYVFIGIGGIFLLLSPIRHGISFTVAISSIIAGVLLLTVYSYLVFARKRD